MLVADGYAALVALAAKTITASGAAAKPREGAASRPARVRAIAFFILISFISD